jgi:hypothetical protein
MRPVQISTQASLDGVKHEQGLDGTQGALEALKGAKLNADEDQKRKS